MKQYYIISLKHTSKGDAALTFWGKCGSGYTWHRDRAGLYPEDKVDAYTSEDNIKVEKEKVDPFWMNAVDFGDRYVSVANTPGVRRELGISDRLMKPKKYATCRMAFTNTAVEPMNETQLAAVSFVQKSLVILLLSFFAACSPSRITPCPMNVGVVFSPDSLKRPFLVKSDTTTPWSRWMISGYYRGSISREFSFDWWDGKKLERPLHLTLKSDTITVNVVEAADTLFGKAAIIKAGGKVFKEYKPTALKRDTVSEWMHISTRAKGFVIAQTALAVRNDGYCIAHLDCDKKPFPVHYRVGWCQGKELLFNRMVKQGRAQ